MPPMIAFDPPPLPQGTPTRRIHWDSTFPVPALAALDGEALTALLRELCAEGSLSPEQLRVMVEAAERIPTTGSRRLA